MQSVQKFAIFVLKLSNWSNFITFEIMNYYGSKLGSKNIFRGGKCPYQYVIHLK